MRITRPPIKNVTALNYASDEQIADFFHMRLTQALKKTTGHIAVAVPRATTPDPILTQLCERPLEWERVMVFPTDDCDVADEHEASAFGSLRSLLEPMGARVVRLIEGMNTPHLALEWLTMGEDGSVASLFPSAEPDPRDVQRVRAVSPDEIAPDAPFARLTLTIPALLDCEEMVFVIRGQSKRVVFEGALKGQHDLPVRALLEARENDAAMPVTCFY
ncbi:MAG: 6-phosphogluconolactonase [Pseudomonadota bacterium]